MRVVDLFSGCGGMSLGFADAGFNVTAAFDNWLPAIEVYKNNFDHPIHQQDLSNISESIKLISSYRPQLGELLTGGVLRKSVPPQLGEF